MGLGLGLGLGSERTISMQPVLAAKKSKERA